MLFNIDTSLLNQTLKLTAYGSLNEDYLNWSAIFSDETENFVSNPEPFPGDSITIFIRVFKDNADRVLLYAEGMSVECEKIRTEGIFDYYGAEIKVFNKTRYYFIVCKGKKLYYYNKKGVFAEADHNFDFMIIPGFRTPGWAKGAVMYQIYVDRFFNGDEYNDPVHFEYIYLSKPVNKVEDWNKPVAVEDVANFYGGDLQGVMNKLDYLKELGVEVIYFNPLFVSPSNHKYDIQDYDYIDPHYGVIIKDGGAPLSFEKFHNKFASMYMQRTTDRDNLEASNELFAKLVKAAHDRGIRVILDGVFNHCGAFCRWLDRENFYGQNGYPVGAYWDSNSIYANYFRWYDDAWPNNECYETWWGHENHPKLYFEGSEELRNFILHIGAKWVSPPYNADGWRLDVAADLGLTKEYNHKFWRDFRDGVKKANPSALIIAEHYGDPSEWLSGDQWDSVMNYDAFMEPVTWFFTGMEKHSEGFKPEMLNNAMAFEGAMRYFMSRFSMPSLLAAMNQLSNHDHSRFLTRTNMRVGRLHTLGTAAADKGVDKRVMLEAVGLQMLWPGSPCVYYGDEAGLTGWTDPDNRRTYPWGKEDGLLMDFHREMIRIRREHEAVRKGSLEYLYMNQGIISFARFLGSQVVFALFNNNENETAFPLPVWKAGVTEGRLVSLIATNSMDVSKKAEEFKVAGGFVNIVLGAKSLLVLSN